MSPVVFLYPLSLVQELQEQLQSSERENQTVRQQLTAELRRKEAELTRAEETIRGEQQQFQKMSQQVSLVCGVCVVTRGPPVTAGD